MDKKFLLEESKTFCMYPWIHLHTQPDGSAAPCCISKSCYTGGVGNSRTQSLMELVNSDKMKQLRSDMLSGTKNDDCFRCYEHEEHGVGSARQSINNDYNDKIDEVLSYTLPDGSLTDFKMYYFDVRFNNICNFKCRTCGSPFSTQWELEDLKSGVAYAKVIPKNDNKKFFNEILNQVGNFDLAYFAGGEPLITEEHYLLLEEMIRLKRNDIKLRYSTNLSTLKFKDKDLFSLWKHFKRVDLWASIDHYGDRAEYIRNGTDWGKVESNFHLLRSHKNIYLQINTVLSIFNYLTIDKFYQYLIDKNMIAPTRGPFTLYVATTPEHISSQILPDEYKVKGQEAVENAIRYLYRNSFKDFFADPLKNVSSVVFSKTAWNEYKEEFRSEVQRLDKLRNEDFSKTFPELQGLLND